MNAKKESVKCIGFVDKRNNLLAFVCLETMTIIESGGYRVLTNLDDDIIKIKGTKDKLTLKSDLKELFHIIKN